MSHSVKTVLILCGIFFSIATHSADAALTSSSSGNQAYSEIHIGIYAPFSNEKAFIGRNILGAMELARDQLKASKVAYSFYTLDRQPRGADSKKTLEQFIKTHHLQVLVTEGSTDGRQFAEIAKKNKLIHFSMASDPSIADGRNNFLMWSPAFEQAHLLINTLKQKKAKQIAVISSNNPSDQLLTQTILGELKRVPEIKLVAFEQYTLKNKNFSGLIQKIKKTKSDYCVVMAPPKDSLMIQSEMNKSDMHLPLTTIVARITPQILKAFNNQWVIDTHEMNPQFVKDYQEAYMNYPATEAGYAYDVFHILNQSILMASKANPNFSSADLAEQIHLLAVGEGVMGPFNLDKKGVLYSQSEVKTIKNGQVMLG